MDTGVLAVATCRHPAGHQNPFALLEGALSTTPLMILFRNPEPLCVTGAGGLLQAMDALSLQYRCWLIAFILLVVSMHLALPISALAAGRRLTPQSNNPGETGRCLVCGLITSLVFGQSFASGATCATRLDAAGQLSHCTAIARQHE